MGPFYVSFNDFFWFVVCLFLVPFALRNLFGALVWVAGPVGKLLELLAGDSREEKVLKATKHYQAIFERKLNRP